MLLSFSFAKRWSQAFFNCVYQCDDQIFCRATSDFSECHKQTKGCTQSVLSLKTQFLWTTNKFSLFFVTFVKAAFQRYSYKKVFWKYAATFTGEHPCQYVVSIRLQSNFIDITLWYGCSPVICCIFSGYLFLRAPLEDCF